MGLLNDIYKKRKNGIAIIDSIEVKLNDDVLETDEFSAKIIKNTSSWENDSWLNKIEIEFEIKNVPTIQDSYIGIHFMYKNKMFKCRLTNLSSGKSSVRFYVECNGETCRIHDGIT
jgi:hypothetical protein